MSYAAPRPGSPTKKSLLQAQSEIVRDADGKFLTEARKAKLLSIRKREEMQDLLVKKLCARVPNNGGTQAEKNEEVVKNEVDSFLGHASITENNLKRLENNIHRKVSLEKTSEIDAYSQADSMRSRASQKSGSGVKTLEQQKAGVKADWSMLDEYAVILHGQDAIRQKNKAKLSQQKLYQELSAQVEANKHKDDYKKVEDQKYFEEGLKQLEQWKIAEEEKMQEMKNKNMVEKQMRDEQLALEKKIREEEDAIRLEDEKKIVAKIQIEIEQEEVKKQKKIEEQRSQFAKLLEENKVHKEKKEQEAKLLVQRDLETIRIYNEQMDEQDRARAAEKEARQERQKALLEKMKNTVAKQAQAKGKEDEIRAAKQKEEADLKALEAALIKQKKLETMRHETQDYQLEQIRAKQERKQQALEFKKMQANVLGADTAAYDAAEMKKEKAKKLKNFEHQKELQQQIREKELRVKNVEMSAAEESINRDLLEHVSRALEEQKKLVTE